MSAASSWHRAVWNRMIRLLHGALEHGLTMPTANLRDDGKFRSENVENSHSQGVQAGEFGAMAAACRMTGVACDRRIHAAAAAQ
ncbi:MAG: hypothetical protein ABI881_14575 [Betaproteobacteria bacterium]